MQRAIGFGQSVSGATGSLGLRGRLRRVGRGAGRVADRAGGVTPEALEARTLLSAVIAADNTAVLLQTNAGAITLELLVDEAPQTVAAFLSYVQDGSYVGSVFHRGAEYPDGSEFVVQGGGYVFNQNERDFDLLGSNGTIPNEPGVSNRERTVAMAKLGNDPNSATRQFFFNMSDRNATDPSGARLDIQNEGFTVFARVVDGWDIVRAIADLNTINGGGAFNELPVLPTFDPNDPAGDPSAFVTITGASIIYEAGDRRVAPGGVVEGGADGQGRTTLVSPVTLGADRVEVFQLDPASGRWTQQDLLRATGRNAFAGSLETFTDAVTGRVSVVAADGSGVVVFSTLDGANWTATNLTTLISGAQAIESDVTVFTSNTGVVHIAGLTDNGELVVYRRGGAQWSYQNLTRTDFAATNATLPALSGELISYVTSWNGLNIAGLDADGNIWAAWTAPGLDTWRVSNLSAITGAPAYQGTLTVFLTSWGAINLAGTTSNGSVVTTWWLPSFGANWRQSDLTDAFGGPALSGDSISSFVTPWGGLNVAGLDAQGRVTAYWWAPGLTDWRIADLSGLVSGVDRPSGAIRGFASPTGIINLVGADADGDVIRYAFDPATLEWTGADLTNASVIEIPTV